MKNKLWSQNQVFRYLLFGVLTTICNFLSFTLFFYYFSNQNAMLANVVSFIIATSFAYITNKIWVFNKKSNNLFVIIKEFTQFTTARIFTFLLEHVTLYISIEYFNVGNKILFGISGILISKFTISMGAVVLNYFISNYMIFNKKKKGRLV